jgi:L-asparagine transporter-like permease
MMGIVLAIAVQLLAPEHAYLYIINGSLVGGMIAWLVSLLAHVRFRAKVSREQLAALGLRSPLGAAGSIAGFVAIIAAVACTWWVQQSSVAAKSAVFYLLILSAGYLVARGRQSSTP